MSLRWFIITGEYPPQPGGVSDYTRVVATALAAAGDHVEIWTGPLLGPVAPAAAPADGVEVHRTADHFGARARAEMAAALDKAPAGTRVLLQYEPWSFGFRGINVPFAWWIRQRSRRRPDLPLTVMFHEVATGWGRGYSFKHSVHGTITHGMASLAARAADRVFMSVPVWGPTLRALMRRDQTVAWLPVPSNVPRVNDPARTAELRARLLADAGGAPDRLIVGHFSTFRGQIPRMLEEMLPRVLAHPACGAVLLLGRGGAEFAAAARERHPEAAGRLLAGGELDLEGLAAHLTACDLLIQPYPDGISSRRTTAMAGLNLGCPIVTNMGHCSDTGLWEKSGAVKVVGSIDPADIAAAAVELMDAPGERARLRERARQFYDERFSVARLVEVLRA